MNDKPRSTLDALQAQAAATDGGLGIVCPRCGWTSLPVLYTRRLAKNETARVRQCRRCRTKVLCKERLVGQIAERAERSPDDLGRPAREGDALTP